MAVPASRPIHPDGIVRLRASGGKSVSRRERLSVMADVLSAIVQEQAKGHAARISNVAARANIAYDRLEPYIQELQDVGIITRPDSGVPDLTPKGREFLRQYRTWLTTLQTYGLE